MRLKCRDFFSRFYLELVLAKLLSTKKERILCKAKTQRRRRTLRLTRRRNAGSCTKAAFYGVRFLMSGSLETVVF